jgi:hypothetical protein
MISPPAAPNHVIFKTMDPRADSGGGVAHPSPIVLVTTGAGSAFMPDPNASGLPVRGESRAHGSAGLECSALRTVRVRARRPQRRRSWITQPIAPRVAGTRLERSLWWAQQERKSHA